MNKAIIFSFPPLYARGKYILVHQGWSAFIKDGFSFIRNLFFNHGTYLIYEKELSNSQRFDGFKPKIDCSFKLINNLKEFYQLVEQGYDFKMVNFKSLLAKGAKAFCLFVGQNLASVTWVAFNIKAKQEIDYIPFEVYFEKGEVCSGGSFTAPEYRGKGLLPYTYNFIFPYLISNNIVKVKFTININNISSQNAHAKLIPNKIDMGRYLKVFWWEYWKGQQLKEDE